MRRPEHKNALLRASRSGDSTLSALPRPRRDAGREVRHGLHDRMAALCVLESKDGPVVPIPGIAADDLPMQ